MAGGKGTRFWPQSTSKRPKQYLNLFSEKSLLAETLTRFDELVPKERRFVITVKEQEDLALNCSNGLTGEGSTFFEPSGRNTSPCILLSLAGLELKGAEDDDVIAVVPSDHVILNKKGFAQTLRYAHEVAVKQDKIVTIGVTPNFPHTGFGYIEKGSEELSQAFAVAQFVEKPNRETAEKYLASGNYLWNAGMFVGSLKRFKEEFQTHAPNSFEKFSSLKNSWSDWQKLSEVYETLEAESIDYEIMEKSKNVMVTPAQFDWNDLGSWDALESVIEPENENVSVNSKQKIISLNAKGNIVYSENQLVALSGVNDLVVVSNDKVLMILPKSESQKVKEIVQKVKDENLLDLL